MRLILNEFENLNSNDIIVKNARYDAIVGLTDPTPPLIDISTDDEWTPQLVVDLTISQWIVDLTTINDGDDEAKFADEISMNNAMTSNVVQPNYVRLLLPGNLKIK